MLRAAIVVAIMDVAEIAEAAVVVAASAEAADNKVVVARAVAVRAATTPRLQRTQGTTMRRMIRMPKIRPLQKPAFKAPAAED
jgi:hypothetical protein